MLMRYEPLVKQGVGVQGPGSLPPSGQQARPNCWRMIKTVISFFFQKTRGGRMRPSLGICLDSWVAASPGREAVGRSSVRLVIGIRSRDQLLHVYGGR
jgi:hypothetical protein